MVRRSKYWTWTLNNPTDDEQQSIVDAAGAIGVVYLCFGRETGDSGTPHLQGYTIFANEIRFTTVKNKLGTQRLHVEASRGSAKQNRDYCKKDGDFEEYGDFPESNQGRRTDLERFFNWADERVATSGRPPSTPEAAREFPGIITRYPRVMQTVRLRFDAPPLEDGDPNDWQSDLESELSSDADDRSITFVVDPEGGKGKSWFVRYLISKFPSDVQFLSVGKRDDIAHVVKEQTRIFLFDVPRGQMEYLQYGVLEQLKNRLVFSPKYNSMTKRLHAVPHVVVFSNEEPDYEKLTEDRFNIKQI